MRKISIAIQDSSLYFKFRNKKLDDVNLLNTNIISNNQLVFSDDYINNNERLVSLFIHDLIKENKINRIIISSNSLFDLAFGLVKKHKEITEVELKDDDALPFEICEAITKSNYIKHVYCYQVPTFMIELFDKAGIVVESSEEVLFTSDFMSDNKLDSYSKIYYCKSISFDGKVTEDDLEDFKTFMFVNKYLKFVAIKKFNEDLLNKIIEIIEENKRKNIVIEIHDNIESDKDALTLKTLNKKLKPKKIKITIVYSKDYMEKNYSKQVILTTLEICALVIFVIIGVVSAFLVYNYYESDRKVGGIQNDLKEIMEEDNDKDKPIYNSVGIPIINNYDKLLEVNSDTVGWLKVKNTNIDYPVLKTTDNDYYLNRNFYKEKDENGWVFMDYRNTIDELGQHTIIYAHNRYYSGVMFGTLRNVTKWKWYKDKENWDITFNTLYEEHTWRIFSIYSIDVTSDYLYTKFNDEEEFQNFLTKITDRSDIWFSTKVTPDDKILTLSTCLTGDRRLVVHAVLVDEE